MYINTVRVLEIVTNNTTNLTFAPIYNLSLNKTDTSLTYLDVDKLGKR